MELPVAARNEAVNVIVTSAGVASAINVIKGLRRQTEIPVRIIGVDADPMAVGLRLSDAQHVVPLANDPRYVPAILGVAARERAVALFPIYSREIEIVAGAAERLRATGLNTFLPEPAVIQLCNDKLRMAKVVGDLGILTPRTIALTELESETTLDFPLILKPRCGSSSSGVVKLNRMRDLSYWRENNPDAILQEFLPGSEVTVDVFCTRQHEAVVISPRLRLAVKSGQSVKAETIPNERFVDPVIRTCKMLRIVGACNLQFIIKDGELFFIELNPRFAAGGLNLTIEAGANIPLLVLRAMLGLMETNSLVDVQPGVRMARYWEEVFWKT